MSVQGFAKIKHPGKVSWDVQVLPLPLLRLRWGGGSVGKGQAALSSSSSSSSTLISTLHQTPPSFPGSSPFSMGWPDWRSQSSQGCCFATEADRSPQAAVPIGAFQRGRRPPVQSSQAGLGMKTSTGGTGSPAGSVWGSQEVQG